MKHKFLVDLSIRQERCEKSHLAAVTVIYVSYLFLKDMALQYHKKGGWELRSRNVIYVL